MRLAEITAALALRQLDGLEAQLARRRAHPRTLRRGRCRLPLRIAGIGSAANDQRTRISWSGSMTRRTERPFGAALRRPGSRPRRTTRSRSRTCRRSPVGWHRRTAVGAWPRGRSRSRSMRDSRTRCRPGHRTRRLLPKMGRGDGPARTGSRGPGSSHGLAARGHRAGRGVHRRALLVAPNERGRTRVRRGPRRGNPAILRLAPRFASGAARISWFGEPLPRGSTDLARFGTDRAWVRPVGIERTVLRAARRAAGPFNRMSLSGRLGAWREAAAIEHERVDNLAMAAWCMLAGPGSS